VRRSHTCPKCGAEMNHQADKLVDPSSREEAEASVAVRGVIVAVFACPRCGWIVGVRVPAEGDSG
jgi:predicted RNA-binding Zn-ribbon protein involved in translation (DUF1610 family)